MPSTRITRSSVLGKRPHQAPSELDAPCSPGHTLLPTPDPTPNPKRTKLDPGNNNKENIPPFSDDALPVFPYARARALRRTSTEVASPSRPFTALRRHASTSDLADGDTIHLPSPPPLLSIYARIKALLRPTSDVHSDMAGRDREGDIIREFVSSFLPSSTTGLDDHPVLYISGSPGTGKTALIKAILHAIQPELDIHNTKVLIVNCMAHTNLDSLWVQLAQDLDSDSTTGRRRGRKTKESPSQRVRRLLTGRDSKCLLVLDELDHIASSSQSLDSLFSLAQANAAHLRLIGIANTHTLTSSSSSTASARTHENVKTLHFEPYSAQQLLGILKSRLSSLSLNDDGVDGAEIMKKFLPVPALNLLTKKIASQTGDVRVVFEVLRGAIDLAISPTVSANPLDPLTPVVTPALILTALKAHAPAGNPAAALPTPSATPVGARKSGDSETVTKVRELGLHARLALLAIFIATKRLDAGLTLSGSPAPSVPSTPTRSPTKRSPSSLTPSPAPSTASASMDSTQLHAYYSAVLTRGEHSVFAPVSRSEFSDLIGVLETVGLVARDAALPGTPSKRGRRSLARTASFGTSGEQDVRFTEGVRIAEVARGLGISGGEAAADVREEEVRAIWERERARISRESKVLRADPEVFAHATED